ncbi:hypothetical protein NPIL_398541 [Nephila pilipes]|uniref:Uncharacterized protein n=1 Tax=Nephila pilipes TaxID=299642 RepID=A0A8X6MN32_NEPPI|nr:hypothetical protein NPIL_398541 [Nephila pilipes]
MRRGRQFPCLTKTCIFLDLYRGAYLMDKSHPVFPKWGHYGPPPFAFCGAPSIIKTIPRESKYRMERSNNSPPLTEPGDIACNSNKAFFPHPSSPPEWMVLLG